MRGAILVRIQDGDGVVGWGETYPTMGRSRATADVGALLLGRDAGGGARQPGPDHRGGRW